MSNSAVVHARISPVTKSKAEAVLARLGLSPTEAIRLFYQQVFLYQGIPFPIKIPNKATRKALKESFEGKNIHKFESLDKLFNSWDK